MEVFTLFGLWIVIWIVLSFIYVVAEFAMSRFEEISPAPFLINIFIAFLIANFILNPEKFGYTKIVSGNEVEMQYKASPTEAEGSDKDG